MPFGDVPCFAITRLKLLASQELLRLGDLRGLWRRRETFERWREHGVRIGGAYDYLAHGKMIGGFALAAYPAVYRTSGVMTFLVNHEETVFEKDLGAHTEDIVEHMTSFNPDDSWKKVAVEASDR